MGRTNTLAVAAAVLFAFAIGLLIGRGIERGEGELRDSAGRSLVAPEVRNPAEGVRRRPFQDVRRADAPRPASETPADFGFDRLILNTNADLPEACLQFTRPLDDAGGTNYADYVRLTPEVKPAVRVAGQSLCLSGLAFDTDYRVRLRAGLPSGAGDKLKRAVDVVVAFGDKPAFAGFAGDGVVLPRLEADGLGLETVNVEKLKVSIYRVSDRSIAQKSLTAGEAFAADDYYYAYGEEDGEDVGVRVYEGEIAVEGRRNEVATTVFPFGAALQSLSPGAYFVRIRDVSPGADIYAPAQAWRWIMFTDMALTSYSSSEGLDVLVRSLGSGRALQGVELQLVAQNNDILFRTTTTAEGRASFPKAAIAGDYPLSPRAVLAFGPQDDFAVLDLARAPLDLSDRDVGGRSASAVADAFVYLDRGIYRPGETVHVSALLRSSSGLADDRPMTVIVTKPNGVEAERKRIDNTSLGGFTTNLDLPASSPRGVWRVAVEADGLGVVGQETFSVEDFVPQRLAVEIKADETTPIRPGEPRELAIESRYLYGAPAAALPVEAEARLRIDPNPFPDLEGFRFGPADQNFQERFLTLDPTTTDDAGRATVRLAADEAPKGVGAPLRADVVVGVVEPGGRPVRDSVRIPVRPDERYVGLKLASEGGGFGENDPVGVDVAVIDWTGARQASEIEWRLVEEDYWFDWYREDGEWRWRRSYKDVLVAEGKESVGIEAYARIAQRLDAGSYRLTAVDPKSGARSDIRFWVGWRSYASGVESPDQAALTLQGESITPGARARLYLDPPYAGEAVIVIATEKVHLVQRLKVEEGGREIIVDTDPSWGAGFYAMATIVTPRSAVDRPVPRRAMGVAYIPFDMSSRTLGVAIDAPEIARPRTKVDLPVTLSGLARGEDAHLTLAAVDEGILRLTKFQSPDPVAHFYGKRRLAVEVRDDYGRILDANLGAATSFGGDQLGGEGLTVVPVKSVALFSGVVRVDDEGRAIVPVDLPDFNGELRLMAVAWAGQRLGSAASPMTVRDPVPALLSTPRFLAPGDEAQMTLLIDNVEGAAGDYVARVTGSGPVEGSVEKPFRLAAREQATAAFPLAASSVGVGDIRLSVDGPQRFSVSRTVPIEVRSAYLPVRTVSINPLGPGETVRLNRSVIEGYLTGSTEVNMSFSPLRGLAPGPLVQSLYRYPYGCSEQLASASMPLLYADLVGAAGGMGPEREIRPRVQRAVNQILDRQGPDGAFGLWREGDGFATPWLGAYLTDFLQRAQAEGYGVPDAALDRSYEALQKIARIDRWSYVRYQLEAFTGAGSNDSTEALRKRSAAYALYVLARAGRADLSDLRYFHDTLLAGMPSPLARAHVGAALAMLGDRARAVSAFEKAVAAIGYDNTGDYYQTPLRDAAGVVALMSEVQGAAGFEDAVDRMSALVREPEALQTQEKAFLLLAAQAMLRSAGETKISMNGEAATSPSPIRSFSLDPSQLEAGVSFTNQGSGAVYGSLSVYGSPLAAPAPYSNGFELQKRIATRDGRPADLGAVRQNERFVVVLTGKPQDRLLHPAVVVDLLPAGFEIEAVLAPEDAGGPDRSGPYAWIGPISRAKVAEARDDRFVAALDLNVDRFTLAYVVRAVTPGAFALPGAVIEDMYRPGLAARTEVGRVAIAAAAE